MIFDCVPPIFILRSVRSRAGPRPKKPGKKRSGKKAWARQSRPWHKGETPAVIRKNGWVVKRYDVTTFSVASSAAKTGTPHTHLQPSGCCGKIRKGYGGNNNKKKSKVCEMIFWVESQPKKSQQTEWRPCRPSWVFPPLAVCWRMAIVLNISNS